MRIGDKWSVLVIARLGERGRRFSELLHDIDAISQRMLTVTLRGLERDGLVSRTVHAVVPPRVDYALTPMGKTLLATVTELARWAKRHTKDIESSRTAYDSRNAMKPARLTPVKRASTTGYLTVKVGKVP